MSRVRIIGVGAALAVFVYIGATATDTRVGALMRIVQSALEADMEWQWIDDVSAIGINGPGMAGIPAAVAFLLLLFGGLPLAVFGLLIDRQWTAIPTQPRRPLHLPYAVLMFQIVSMGLSAFGLAMMGDALVWALSEGMMVRLSDWFLPAYFALQILASIVVIPVWRRVLLNASDVRTSVLLLNRA
jgi:hypothetical protein